MRQVLFLAVCVAVGGCGGLAWDTRMASQPATRLAMITSVEPGLTTEPQFVVRWGNPLQKAYDGGRVDYIYRARTGDQADFVIVTFEYGVAIAVRSSETEGCRSSFAPRVPGYGWDTPDIVKPVGWCADPNDPYDPNGFWKRLTQESYAPPTVAGAPGVPDDTYVPGEGSIK